MKFNYKKIASVFASAVMLSSTMGFAAAAAYPTPFVKSGAADVAIVYGSAAAADIDMSNAVNIVKADLDKKVTVKAASTVEGGESYLIQRSTNTKFHLGRGVKDVVSNGAISVADDVLPTMLADGEYLNSANTKYTYSQKLTLSNLTYGFFENDDYKAYTPALGMVINSDTNVLNYTLEFNSNPAWSTLAGTDLEIMGKTYYISEVTANSTIVLLDSAQRDTVTESDVKTITIGSKSYTVKIPTSGLSGTASSAKVRLEVNGELTNKLSEGQSQQLTDGTYVGIRTISMRDVAGTAGSVEFSLGTGQLKLVNNTEVKLNDKTVDKLWGYTDVDSSGNLQKIRIIWKQDDQGFVADGSDVSLPGFQTLKLTYGGLKTPASTETIVVKDNGDDRMEITLPIKDGDVTIPLLYGDTTTSLYTGMGSSSTHNLKTTATTSIVFNASTGADDEFVASYGNGKDYESYLLRANSFEQIGDSKINKTTIQKRVGGEWVDVKTVQENDEITNLGNVILTVGPIKHSDRTVNLTAGSSVNFNTLYSKSGMKIWLPYSANASAAPGAIDLDQQAGDSAAGLGHNLTAFDLVLTEQNKDLDIGAGKNLTLRLAWSSQKVTVSTVTGKTVSDIQTGDGTKIWKNYLYSPLATSYEWDKTGDQYFVTVTYNGDESAGQFFIASSSATLGGDSSIKVFKDTQSDSFKDMNLIVVGGSCVNQVSVRLLEGTDVMCGEAFTAKTGGKVTSGKYIIKTFQSPYNTAKVATLVAGYNADDTKAALSKLIGGVSTELNAEEIGPALG